MTINKPRGTNDIFFDDINIFNYFCDSLRLISKIFNYNEIITPIFESKELFVRNIGETSDIVTKEFYDFKDKGSRDMVLRPEGTVPVIRSVVENKLISKKPLPLKFFYIQPMFRYERPQKGRNRQFFQYGVEKIGIKSIYEQIEIIILGLSILSTFNVNDYQLKINYIGSIETRQKWIDELNKYFSKHKDELSEDSLKRIDKNPLRILDDKVDGRKKIVQDAPKIDTFLTDDEKKEWETLKENLDRLKINYSIDGTMVRGLDYYFGMVFEFVSLREELSQSTIIGGGKYSKLVNELGGPECDCVGFALGIERLIEAHQLENKVELNNSIDVYLATLGDTKLSGLLITKLLRTLGFCCENNFNLNKLDKHFKYAETFNPKIILIFGDKEKENEIIILKNQMTKKESTIPLDKLVIYLKEELNQ